MKEWESMVNDAKSILELLEIPYREMMLSTGDIGFSSAKPLIWNYEFHQNKDIEKQAQFLYAEISKVVGQN